MCQHPPPTKTLFCQIYVLHTCILAIPTLIYGANENFLKFTDLFLPHSNTLNACNILLNINYKFMHIVCSIPVYESLPQNGFLQSIILHSFHHRSFPCRSVPSVDSYYHRFPCSSVKSDLYQNFCLFYSQTLLAMLHDWQGWLHSD